MVQRRLRVIAGVAALGSALAACNLIAGLGEDFRVGETGGGAEGGGDAIAADGAVEGASPGDSQTDTQPLVDASTEDALCPSTAFFCDDFEGPRTTPFGWNQAVDMSLDASIAVEPGMGFNGASQGLRVAKYERTPDFSTGTNAYLMKIVASGNPGAYLRFDVGFHFRRLKMDTDYAELAILTFPNGAADREHGVAAYELDLVSTLKIAGAKAQNDGAMWHRANVILSRPTALTATFARTVIIDGVIVDATTGYSFPTTGNTELRLGVQNLGQRTGVVEAAYDNVSISRSP
jgi:predicted small secreted protein